MERGMEQGVTRWSVGILAEGDRVMGRAEIVELADAVAPSGGIATGIGSTRYGAQLVVVAPTREEAIERGRVAFASAVAKAGLPVHPIVRVEAVSEAEDAEDGADDPDDPDDPGGTGR